MRSHNRSMRASPGSLGRRLPLRAAALAFILFLGPTLARAQDVREGEPSPQGVEVDEPDAFDADSFFGEAVPVGEGEAGAASGATASPTRRSAPGLSFSGEAATDLVASIASPFEPDARSASYLGRSSVRIDASGGDSDAAALQASLSVSLLYGAAADAARASLSAAAGASGLAALAGILGSSDGPIPAIELRKLYLSIHTALADVSAGRMILNYGRGTAFSPIDLFSSLDASGLSLGRRGTDALRLLVPLSDFSGVDAAATLASAPEKGIAGLRHYGDAGGVAYGLAAYRDGSRLAGGELVVGADLKGDLLAGVSAEAVARLPLDAWEPRPDDASFAFMLGLDYSLRGRLFLDVEVLWNIACGQAVIAGQFAEAWHAFASVSWSVDEGLSLDARGFYDAAGAMEATLGASLVPASGSRLTAFARYARAAGGDDSLAPGLRLSVAY